MDNQLLIKAVLLGAIAILAVLILLPGKGARSLALRRIALLFVVLLAAIAVIFPQITNSVANLFGVGRGADLLLYGLVVAFAVSLITRRVHLARLDTQITELARALALSQAEKPEHRE